jgi:uncharacterized protein
MTLTEWNRLVSRLSKKAEAGDPEAQWELGAWIEDGFINRHGVVVVPEDRRTALRWFRCSAMSGNASAQIHLGVYLSGGRCTRRDDVQALFWFKRALRQGCSIAPNNIASVYRDREDHRRALFWYERAAVGGDGDALVEVGIQYYAGQGVRRNPKHAVRCFCKAIRSRNISQLGREVAMFRLGMAYREGQGVKQSNAKALEWLSTANRDDDYPAARTVIETIKREASRKTKCKNSPNSSRISEHLPEVNSALFRVQRRRPSPGLPEACERR